MEHANVMDPSAESSIAAGANGTQETPPVVLEARGLTIGYRQGRRQTSVVSGINIALRRGELVCLLGPNGAGKSTLMRTVAGMHPPLAGRVLLHGQDVSTFTPQERARHLSLVLTERINTGNLPARELVALGRYPHTDWVGRLTERDAAVVRWALEAVGATALAERSILELSDGERQKVMIARALAQEPALMLLDEPTAYLDLPRRVEIMSTLRHLAHAAGRTVLLSTHDLDLALRSADRIWLLSSEGDLHDGTPEDLVLNGSFAATFESQGVTFDPVSGSFQMQQPWNGEVSLHGEGLAAEWTRRALRRRGFRIAQDGAPVQIRVDGANGTPTWRIRSNRGEAELHSISALLAFVDAQN